MVDDRPAPAVDDGNRATLPDGYNKPVPVDRFKLINLGINRECCRRFAAQRQSVALNLVEFFHALPYFPIAFVRIRPTLFMPCALLGLQQNENLFTGEGGHWPEEVYQPAYLRRYPFITGSLSDEEIDGEDEDCRKPIFVDETALDEKAPSLFIGDGKATDEWLAVESFVSEYITAERQSAAFTRKLVEHRLLEPFDAQIHPDNGDMFRLKGLYRVNENRLNRLPDKVIKRMMTGGELSRIYAHLISLENFAKLLDRSAARKGGDKSRLSR
ncbi:MAG TPA: hypothetical protein ENJ64_02250 [Thiotrichales bacterium]|nr:hypothetical protein [Thiotrichales bacterium]